MFHIFILIAILVVVYFIYTRNSVYKKIDTEIDNYDVRKYIMLTKLNPMNRSIDFYQLGCVYDYVYKSPQIASTYYKKALKKIPNKPKRHDAFVLQKVADRINLDPYLDVDENIQPHLSKADLPQKTINLENRINWETDNNNVHDTNINDELVAKIKKIMGRADTITFDDACNILFAVQLPDGEKKNIEPAKKTVDHMRLYNQFLNSAQLYECDIFSSVVADIDRNFNAERKQVLFENLFSNLSDASSNGMVCLNGRVARILDTYTDGEYEKMMTVQAWKNELFEKARQVRDSMIEIMTDGEKAKFDADDPEIVQKIIKQMKMEVSVLGAPPKVVNSVSEELNHCL